MENLPTIAVRDFSGITIRYASALFDLAAERGAVDRVGRDLKQLSDMINQNADLKSMVASPLIRKNEQVNAMVSLTERVGMDVLSRNFVGLICSNRRLHQLQKMIEAFNFLFSLDKGEIFADLISSHKLSDEQIKKIQNKIESEIGSKINLRIKTDSSLIGGFIIQIGSKMIDNSIKTKLENLRLVMKGSK